MLEAVILSGGTQDNSILIKVMNPWGKDEYTGPWSDNDSRWTEEYKRQVNLVINDNDGIFYIPLKDNDGNEIFR
jgi:hypothetical protein